MLLQLFRFELDVTKSVMIGDRLDTDILFGKQSGLATILVMTGVTKKSDLHDSTILPDYYLPSLSSLVYDFSNQVQVDRIDRSINRLEVDE